MLITIQFPICDARRFDARYEPLLLRRPLWPIAESDIEHVRQFGGIVSRPQGGINGWLQEHNICNARRSVRIDLSGLNDLGIKTRIIFKRLYFDGKACAKLEIGIRIDQDRENSPISEQQLLLTLTALLNLKCSFRNSNQVFPLVKLGKPISQKYFVSTVTRNNSVSLSDYGLVKAGRPMVFIDCPAGSVEFKDFGYSATKTKFKLIDLPKLNIDTDGIYRYRYLRFCNNFKHNGYSIPIWSFQHADNNVQTRNIRLYLSRIHAEQECLRIVLGLIRLKILQIDARTEESQKLQNYLTNAVEHINILKKRTCLTEDKEEVLALMADGAAKPGLTAAISSTMQAYYINYESKIYLEALKQIDMRPTVMRKVDNYIQSNPSIFYIGDLRVSNYTNFGSAGAFGDNAKAENFIINQGGLDIEKIKDELEKLVNELDRSEPSNESERKVVIETANAAKAGNYEQMIACAKKIGEVSLAIAKNIKLSEVVSLIQALHH